MVWAEFVLAVISSLAWPVIVVWAVWLLARLAREE